MYNPGANTNSENGIALHRNENLFIDPAFMGKLMDQALEGIRVNMYPDTNNLQLREKIAKMYGCCFEQVYIGNGADGVLADLFHYFKGEFDEMGLMDRTYQVYPYLCNRYGYKQKALDETDQLWVIDSPNSIDGGTFDFDGIKTRPKFLIWDNVYGEFDPENKEPIFNDTKVLRINSFSKFYGLAGLRIGYCIGDKDLISKLQARKDIFNVNKFAQKMGVLALENKDYFCSILPKMKLSKEKLISGLLELGFIVKDSKASFLWIFHPKVDSALLEAELRNQEIFVRHFQKETLKQGLRVSIAPLAVVDKLLKALKIILAEKMA